MLRAIPHSMLSMTDHQLTATARFLIPLSQTPTPHPKPANIPSAMSTESTTIIRSSMKSMAILVTIPWFSASARMTAIGTMAELIQDIPRIKSRPTAMSPLSWDARSRQEHSISLTWFSISAMKTEQTASVRIWISKMLFSKTRTEISFFLQTVWIRLAAHHHLTRTQERLLSSRPEQIATQILMIICQATVQRLKQARSTLFWWTIRQRRLCR